MSWLNFTNLPYTPYIDDFNPCSPEATAERRKRWRARMKERIKQAEERSQLHEAKCLRADLRRG